MAFSTFRLPKLKSMDKCLVEAVSMQQLLKEVLTVDRKSGNIVCQKKLEHPSCPGLVFGKVIVIMVRYEALVNANAQLIH